MIKNIASALWKAWMAFSHVFGMIMSRIILSVFWAICIGIYGLAVRCVYKSTSSKETYWQQPQSDYSNSIAHQF